MYKQFVDCILFSFNQKKYILPTVAFAELGALHEYQVQIKDFCLGKLLWRGLTLPLIRSDLTQASAEESHPKFAVLNALSENNKISYFAILIDNRPAKLKINPDNLTWHDDIQKIALYKKNQEEAKKVILMDLKLLSKSVEDL